MSKDRPVELPLDDHAQLVNDYLAACDDLDGAQARKDELREQLLPLVKDGDVITLGGKPVLRHSFSQGSERVNTEWLRRTWPDIYVSSLKLGAPNHRIAVVKEKLP